MTKPRLGKKDSIFASTTPTVKVKTKLAPIVVGPPTFPSVENKMTVILPPDQVEFLDRLALDIRSKTGWKCRRTEIIRALVGALMKADIDLIDSRSEEDIVNAVAAKLTTG